MPTFFVESSLPITPTQLATDIFCMEGVDYELKPLIRMTFPEELIYKDFRTLLKNKVLFKSYILLFGIIPIDVHNLKLKTITDLSFYETSDSLMNLQWNHRRRIMPQGDAAVLRDEVVYLPRFKRIGSWFRPLYWLIFKHRHRRLKRKYR